MSELPCFLIQSAQTTFIHTQPDFTFLAFEDVCNIGMAQAGWVYQDYACSA